MKGGEYDCEKCEALRIPKEPDENGIVHYVTGPEYNGCHGKPLNPAPVLFENGEALDRCPQAIVRDWESWEPFQEAWWWKKSYGDWPDEDVGKGWQKQSAVFIEAIKIFDSELAKYGQKRRSRSNSQDQRSSIQGH